MLAFATIAIAMVGCKALPFPDPHYEGAYGQVLKRWTRTLTLYSGLETRAFVRVVYLSPEVVEAQTAEIVRLRDELPDQAAQTLERMRYENRKPSFFAVAYLPDRTANDWDAANSVWRLAVNMGLGEQSPEKVERFERPFNAEMRVLYPYLDEYSIAYKITFPPPLPPVGAPEFVPTEVQFVAAGAPGKLRFGWTLPDGSDPLEHVKGEGGPPQGRQSSP
jgi:hypothetical protein